jgi:hypothetical protein
MEAQNCRMQNKNLKYENHRSSKSKINAEDEFTYAWHKE